MRTPKVVIPLAALALMASGCNHIARVSVATGGGQLDRQSAQSSVSDDGGIVAFVSYTSLDPADTGNDLDVFVREVGPDLTYRISSGPAGEDVGGSSYSPSVSGNGRFVAWSSTGQDIVAADADPTEDVFVTDLATGITTLESVATGGGTKGNGPSAAPAISDDGRYVVFQSGASNLVPGDTNGATDVFRRDRTTNTTVRVSTTSGGGTAGDGNSTQPSISDDGAVVAFTSAATNLVAGDTNGATDVFRWTPTTTARISLTSSGGQASGDSQRPSVDADGSIIAFESDGPLVPADTTASTVPNVYAWDGGTIDLVSARPDGTAGRGERPSVDDTGRHVTFDTVDALILGVSAPIQVVTRDRTRDITTLMSSTVGGAPGGGVASDAAISGDARVVLFTSSSTNLVDADFDGTPDDTNGFPDVFMKVYPHPDPSAASPGAIAAGDSDSVIISGEHFRAPVVVAALSNPDVTISNVSVIDEQTIKVTVTVAPGASPGAVTLTVKNVSFGLGATGYCGGCLTIA